jgi:hypothetical protein
MVFNILLYKFKFKAAIITIKLYKPLIPTILGLLFYYFIKYINKPVKY